MTRNGLALGDAEVEHLHPPIEGHEDVGGGEVAVDDPERPALAIQSVVGPVQPSAGVGDDSQRQPQRNEMTALLSPLLDVRQASPVQELHRDVKVVALLPEVQHLHHVGVVDEAHEPRLVEEHLDHLLLARELRQKPLHHHPLAKAFRALLLREKELRHAADSQAGHEPIAAEALDGR